MNAVGGAAVTRPSHGMDTPYRGGVKPEGNRKHRSTVDAGPAAEHLRKLIDAGALRIAISHACGLSRHALLDILTGTQRRIYQSTEAAILAVQFSPELCRRKTASKSCGGRAPGERARQVVEDTAALLALGVSREDIAERLGITWNTVVMHHIRCGVSLKEELRPVRRVTEGGPVVRERDTSWRDRALCLMREIDPELWFPDGFLRDEDVAKAMEARRICLNCPVLAECRAKAMADEHGAPASMRWGVRAAMMPQDRWELEQRERTAVLA